MTEADIQDALGAVERALKHASDAERCAKHGLKEDQSGSAHQAWQSASMVVRELGCEPNQAVAGFVVL
ncbi:hypothetical protein [Methylobacterium longum]|uniref:Uncharacterized protein n=1 Tax=Methylobacterium longum TaxID=767694 RepID=A0ABT8AJC6_9HYPH|nr:hypothetical protein [Methylobacterium longum]MDN3569972.1 hypothetical protein [Methylobacterium longum]GJE12758.1 hypothetical protein FOHLNKBM_3810 [Methylobacterium longum]